MIEYHIYKPFTLHVAYQRCKEAGEFPGKISKLIAVVLALGLFIVCGAVNVLALTQPVQRL